MNENDKLNYKLVLEDNDKTTTLIMPQCPSRVIGMFLPILLRDKGYKSVHIETMTDDEVNACAGDCEIVNL